MEDPIVAALKGIDDEAEVALRVVTELTRAVVGLHERVGHLEAELRKTNASLCEHISFGAE